MQNALEHILYFMRIPRANLGQHQHTIITASAFYVVYISHTCEFELVSAFDSFAVTIRLLLLLLVKWRMFTKHCVAYTTFELVIHFSTENYRIDSKQLRSPICSINSLKFSRRISIAPKYIFISFIIL